MIEAALAALRAAGATRVVITFDLGAAPVVAPSPEPEPEPTAEPASVRAAREAAEEAEAELSDPTFAATSVRLKPRAEASDG